MNARTPPAGAFFDVDGTLFGRGTNRHFVFHLVRKRKLSPAFVLRLIPWVVMRRLRPAEDDERAFVEERSLSVCRGLDHEEVVEEFRHCFERFYRPRIYPEVLQRIRRHQQQGHAVVFVSAAYEPLVQVVVERLGGDLAYGTRMVLTDGRFTGEIAGEVHIGHVKLHSLTHAADRLGFSLEQSYAYADSFVDRFMLSGVGHPVCVNPDVKLRQLALASGWEILRTRW